MHVWFPERRRDFQALTLDAFPDATPNDAKRLSSLREGVHARHVLEKALCLTAWCDPFFCLAGPQPNAAAFLRKTYARYAPMSDAELLHMHHKLHSFLSEMREIARLLSEYRLLDVTSFWHGGLMSLYAAFDAYAFLRDQAPFLQQGAMLRDSRSSGSANVPVGMPFRALFERRDVPFSQVIQTFVPEFDWRALRRKNIFQRVFHSENDTVNSTAEPSSDRFHHHVEYIARDLLPRVRKALAYFAAIREEHIAWELIHTRKRLAEVLSEGDSRVALPTLGVFRFSFDALHQFLAKGVMLVGEIERCAIADGAEFSLLENSLRALATHFDAPPAVFRRPIPYVASRA